MERIALYRDSFQNWKSHDISKAQLILTDIPYQLGANAYGSNPMWYEGGDNSNGESKFAKQSFFDTDTKAGFRISEFFHFCSNLLIKEPKEKNKAGCMILFCAFEQIPELIEYAKKAGFNHYINLIFYKNYSAQVLKANMRVVGNSEYALLFYKDKLPKFNNNGKMIFNCLPWMEDKETPKIHPTQKPVPLLEFLIRTFTDVDDVVIDCCAGSGTTLLAAANLGRRAYGFELKKEFVDGFYEKLLPLQSQDMFIVNEQEEKKARQLELFGA
ncbi:MAG: site-specific DNA-methyltransferase [Treponema sp.]|nr:site-specific DNA-methyltransferase [Treponema sp.]